MPESLPVDILATKPGFGEATRLALVLALGEHNTRYDLHGGVRGFGLSVVLGNTKAQSL